MVNIVINRKIHLYTFYFNKIKDQQLPFDLVYSSMKNDVIPVVVIYFNALFKSLPKIIYNSGQHRLVNQMHIFSFGIYRFN